MIVKCMRGLLLVPVLLLSVAACNTREPASMQGFAQYLSDLESIGRSIATATGYAPEHVYVTGNRTELHISILDSRLLAAEAPALATAATAVVAAAEPALAAHAEFATVQVIRVGIHHPGGLVPPFSDWHSENVLEFRRGANQRFAMQGS